MYDLITTFMKRYENFHYNYNKLIYFYVFLNNLYTQNTVSLNPIKFVCFDYIIWLLYG